MNVIGVRVRTVEGDAKGRESRDSLYRLRGQRAQWRGRRRQKRTWNGASSGMSTNGTGPSPMANDLKPKQWPSEAGLPKRGRSGARVRDEGDDSDAGEGHGARVQAGADAEERDDDGDGGAVEEALPAEALDTLVNGCTSKRVR